MVFPFGQSSLRGCVSSGPGGKHLLNEKDGKLYVLIGKTSLVPTGETVELRGSKEKDDGGGEPAFIVKKLSKDYGPCQSAAPTPPPSTASLTCSVIDAATHRPIATATVVAGAASAKTDARGDCALANLHPGTVSASASAPGYYRQTVSVNLGGGSSGQVRFELHLHSAASSDLDSSVGQSGTATLYGVQFDTNSSTLRPDSTATLEKALAVILKRPNSHWIVSGHTDNQGHAEFNRKLSEARAAAVEAWFVAHGVEASRLTAKGYGATLPVADNSTEQGRAKNRHVELTLVQ